MEDEILMSPQVGWRSSFPSVEMLCSYCSNLAMLHNISVRATTPFGSQEDQLEEDGEEEDGPPLQAHDPRHVQYLAGFAARQSVIN